MSRISVTRRFINPKTQAPNRRAAECARVFGALFFCVNLRQLFTVPSLFISEGDAADNESIPTLFYVPYFRNIGPICAAVLAVSPIQRTPRWRRARDSSARRPAMPSDSTQGDSVRSFNKGYQRESLNMGYRVGQASIGYQRGAEFHRVVKRAGSFSMF